jgi:hypothetical protein
MPVINALIITAKRVKCRVGLVNPVFMYNKFHPDCAHARGTVSGSKKKVFFFEKKNQKTFENGLRGPTLSESPMPIDKVFCFFFQRRRPFFLYLWCNHRLLRHLT